MWNRPRPEKVSQSEISIDRRDKTIRELVDELVAGTQELKALIHSEGSNEPKTNHR